MDVFYQSRKESVDEVGTESAQWRLNEDTYLPPVFELRIYAEHISSVMYDILVLIHR